VLRAVRRRRRGVVGFIMREVWGVGRGWLWRNLRVEDLSREAGVDGFRVPINVFLYFVSVVYGSLKMLQCGRK
jgi:hypothetical protein